MHLEKIKPRQVYSIKATTKEKLIIFIQKNQPHSNKNKSIISKKNYQKNLCVIHFHFFCNFGYGL